jgi:hypothetical protein
LQNFWSSCSEKDKTGGILTFFGTEIVEMPPGHIFVHGWDLPDPGKPAYSSKPVAGNQFIVQSSSVSPAGQLLLSKG